MSKPTVFGLSGEAKNFVFSNIPLFFNHIKIIFPLLLVVNIIKQAGQMEHAQWVAWSMSAVTLFIFACFALAWHRSSLTGPDKAHEVNPVTLKNDDWKFIGIFVVVSAIFGITMEALNHIANDALPDYGRGIALVGGIGLLILMGVLILFFIRASFLFPARSVGVKLSWADAKRASKGLLWPLIGSNIIFVLIFSVAFSVYVFIVGFIVTVARGGAAPSGMEGFAVDFLLSIPVLLATLLLGALWITSLSRAYQWGIQNNPVQMKS